MNSYYDNIYNEIKNLNRKSIGQARKCAPTPSKEKHTLKLLRYELMALGSFKLARLFK